MRVCSSHGVPVLARGGATSLNGQAVNVAVVIDCSKYLDRVLSIDAQARLARVEPGVVCDTLRDAAEAHGLTFAPDPATHSRCTLGGMIGNNSCGPHSVMGGTTVQNIERLEVLTYDGAGSGAGPPPMRIFTTFFPRGRRAEIYSSLKASRTSTRTASGRDSRRSAGASRATASTSSCPRTASTWRALVGSEGTCALTLQAETRLVKSPPHRVLVVLGFPDIGAAGDAVPRVLAAGPIACEGLDEAIIGGLRERGLRLDDIALLPPGKAWLMVEFGGDTEKEAWRKHVNSRIADHRQESHLPPLDHPRDRRLGDRAQPGRQGRRPGRRLGGRRGRSDAAGRIPARVPGARRSLRLPHLALRALRRRLHPRAHQLRAAHARGPHALAALPHRGGELVVKYGGSLSGEHGDGQAKGELLPIMFGPELMQAFREFKRAWDPQNRMNPGKLIDALPLDATCASGRVQACQCQDRFFVPEPGRRWVRPRGRALHRHGQVPPAAAARCARATAPRTKNATPRGRARLLAEMLRGEVITEGLGERRGEGSARLVPRLQGCRSDCPTHTDMAAYKAEFLSHYYETHRRPRQAWSMGRIGEWAPLASRFSAI